MPWQANEIAYCANVHPGTSSREIENNLRNITSRVRDYSGLVRMHAGLWICEQALTEYQHSTQRAKLRTLLENERITVVTLNGFPQGDFHQSVVKSNVYQPNWLTDARLEYTNALASLLAFLLPQNESYGTISTLPLAYRHDWELRGKDIACSHLIAFAQHAQSIEATTNKQIRLCLEMEPGCVLEKTSDVLNFFEYLRAYENGRHASLISRYLGVCFDICHQAVMQEDIADSIRQIKNHDISIGKIQVSSALKVDALDTLEKKRLLQPFAEPKYLHQVTTVDDNGAVLFCDDLVDALENSSMLACSPWWVHYHLPIQVDTVSHASDRLENLSTTRNQIEAFFDHVSMLEYLPHIEIETYTWHVLPEAQRPKDNPSLVEGLVNERAWLVEQLKKRNLLTSNEK